MAGVPKFFLGAFERFVQPMITSAARHAISGSLIPILEASGYLKLTDAQNFLGATLWLVSWVLSVVDKIAEDGKVQTALYTAPPGTVAIPTAQVYTVSQGAAAPAHVSPGAIAATATEPEHNAPIPNP